MNSDTIHIEKDESTTTLLQDRAARCLASTRAARVPICKNAMTLLQQHRTRLQISISSAGLLLGG